MTTSKSPAFRGNNRLTISGFTIHTGLSLKRPRGSPIHHLAEPAARWPVSITTSSHWPREATPALAAHRGQVLPVGLLQLQILCCQKPHRLLFEFIPAPSAAMDRPDSARLFHSQQAFIAERAPDGIRQRCRIDAPQSASRSRNLARIKNAASGECPGSRPEGLIGCQGWNRRQDFICRYA